MTELAKVSALMAKNEDLKEAKIKLKDIYPIKKFKVFSTTL